MNNLKNKKNKGELNMENIIVKDYLKALSDTYECDVKVSITHVDTITDVTLRSDVISMVAQLLIAPSALKSFKTTIESDEDGFLTLEKVSFKKGDVDWFATISFVETDDGDANIMVNVISTDEDLSVATLKEKEIKSIYKI